MKSIITFIIGLMLVIGIAMIGVNLLDNVAFESPNDRVELELEEQQNEPEKEKDPSSQTGDNLALHQWIYRGRDDLINTYGEPNRIDPTPYGYEWHVYQSNGDDKQFAVNKEGEIVSAYSNSETVLLDKLQVGDEFEVVSSIYPFEKKNTISKTLTYFTFELTDEELMMRPLANVDDGIWAQFYFDTFTEELSSVRYLDEETLLVQRPYSLSYNGDLPEQERLSAEEKKKWRDGQAKQIIELTNEIRGKHELNHLKWHDGAAQTAFLHSKEMFELNYFSHTSEIEGELSDRLSKERVPYQMAGENIAAKYIDGIAAVEGWLNSEGHRVNLLNEEFTHLGVGVYEDYYTQNFISLR